MVRKLRTLLSVTNIENLVNDAMKQLAAIELGIKTRRRVGRHGRTHALLALATAAFAMALASASPRAQGFDVPEGFVVVQDPQQLKDAKWRYLLTVRPVEGPFSHLSAIHLREVTGDVADPEHWLKARFSGDLGEAGEIERLLESPDSPFGDPAFDVLRKVIPQLFEGFRALAEIPLQFCDGPRLGYNASGNFHELYCVFNLGPVRDYHILRLQQAADRWFYTEIATMNERRLRHLLAIANSFEAGP